MKNYPLFRCLMVLTLGLLVTVSMTFPEARAVDFSIMHIQQGQNIQVYDNIDITGVTPPYPQLAYWDGNGSYDSAPTYIITLPTYRDGLNNFYVDPAIFATRPGSWYKYDEKIGYESKENNLAFVVIGENPAPVITNSPTKDITKTVIPIPTLSAPTHSPTPALTYPSPQYTSEKGEYAIGISIVVVGLFFGFFELYRLKFSK